MPPATPPSGSAGSQHGASPHPRKRYVSGAGPAGGGAPASAAASTSSGRLVRSLSEGSLAPSLLAVELAPPTAHRPYPLQEASRKVSRSMDSLRGRGEYGCGVGEGGVSLISREDFL